MIGDPLINNKTLPSRFSLFLAQNKTNIKNLHKKSVADLIYLEIDPPEKRTHQSTTAQHYKTIPPTSASEPPVRIPMRALAGGA